MRKFENPESNEFSIHIHGIRRVSLGEQLNDEVDDEKIKDKMQKWKTKMRKNKLGFLEKL